MAEELAALIRVCKAEPDDDAPRLILADWLDENGETEYAAFVRQQIRTGDLFVDHCPAEPNWLEPWKRLGDHLRSVPTSTGGYALQFNRGFLRVEDWYRDLYDHLPQILSPPFDWTWLEGIKFGTWHDGDWTPLFQSPLLLQLNRLEFMDDGYNSVLLKPLLDCRYLTGLRHLRLVMVSLDDEGVARLSNCHGLAGLRSLDLTEMPLGVATGRALATSELWDQLCSCRIIGSRIGDAGLAEFARGRPRTRLERLDLTIGDYSDRGLIELARSDRFAALRELGIGYRRIGEDGCHFGPDGVSVLLEAPQLKRVRITVTVISDDLIPQDLCDLACSHPHRLVVRYRNPRSGMSTFEVWPPADPRLHIQPASGAP